MKNRTDKILLGMSLVSLAIYIAIFAACFSELPINPTPLHQALVLYFHGIPMFSVQLLLCRLSKSWWWRLIPFLPILAAGLVFMSIAEWYILGWILVLWWCFAPTAGCLLAWAVSFLCKRPVRKEGT